MAHGHGAATASRSKQATQGRAVGAPGEGRHRGNRLESTQHDSKTNSVHGVDLEIRKLH